MSERRVDTPFFLRFAMALGGVFGVLGTGVGLWGLFRIALADGPFDFNGDLMSKSEFLVVAVPFLLLYVLACVTAGTASWALWKQQHRSRVLLVALLAEFVMGDAAMLFLAGRRFEVGATELVTSGLLFAVVVSLALWYLYRRESVVRYYESVGQMPTGQTSPFA